MPGTVSSAAVRPAPASLSRRFFRVLGWLLIAWALVTLILILRLTPPPQVKADPQAAQRVQWKLQQLETAEVAGQPQVLRLDEAELNTYLSSHLALEMAAGEPGRPVSSGAEEIRSSVRAVRINLNGDRVRAYVLFDLHGKDMSLLLEGRLRVQDGYVRLEPTGGKLGSLPIPRSALETAVRRLFESPENREKFRLPPDVKDLHIENSEVVVAYR